jgi:hypothetical protein
MSFPVKLFTIKRNFVFMNNIYYKFAVTSVCTALGFALGADEKAYSTTFTLTPDVSLGVLDSNGSAQSMGDFGGYVWKVTNYGLDAGGIGEFDISSLLLAPTTVISSAVFQAQILTTASGGTLPVGHFRPGSLGIFSYVRNEKGNLSNFKAGVFLSSVDISSLSTGDTFKFDVTTFVNQRVSNRDPFAGFAIRALDDGAVALGNSNFRVGFPDLVVETPDVAEPVPEPTTILGSAIALGLGGWLKRKNLSQR